MFKTSYECLKVQKRPHMIALYTRRNLGFFKFESAVYVFIRNIQEWGALSFCTDRCRSQITIQGGALKIELDDTLYIWYNRMNLRTESAPPLILPSHSSISLKYFLYVRLKIWFTSRLFFQHFEVHHLLCAYCANILCSSFQIFAH